LCLFIEANPKPIPLSGAGEVGIDPGFLSLVTLSTGEKIEHPRELQRTAVRLAQAQRGNRKRLAARLLERQADQRKDRNHKLSRRLVAENALIAWSRDSHRAIARTLGKSVTSAAHGQLRSMLAYKCRAGGRRFVEVSNRYSTVTCGVCGARSGPSGYAGLKVRQWRCGCGAELDRDCNAAENTLRAARGMRVECVREDAPGIA
jgi:putative transposase